jgi:hypothetical protein
VRSPVIIISRAREKQRGTNGEEKPASPNITAELADSKRIVSTNRAFSVG